ncbi:oxidoreductase [Mucilaginibacter sabulilitoris]|uniref:Oxidoreductase n=1 Tax=Mucilaginibacter sabulilitoris TaxID=1173583 RepID=A0ABZ0TNR1_9SPHI|nr:oxidoreductase [Mucilaginibacter sabulilitoris]WPU94738.1 oxidoreductase [Mucilaginibacter sabulilitoris]
MWTKKDIPDQTGKIAIVTGANTGIGFETARALFEKGAHVIIASRDAEKGLDAIKRLKSAGVHGELELGILNLACLEDIKTFAEVFKKSHQKLDLLINNAGVMKPPAGKSEDGFELQFGVNFIGHFALTAHLYDLLQHTKGARVVTVSSGASRFIEQIDYDNLKLEKPYDDFREYSTSKLANLYFANELNRRAAGTITSIAAHPGVVYTELTRHIPDNELEVAFARFPTVMQPWQGALPSLYAATSPEAEGGAYYAPDGEGELSGYPAPVTIVTPAMRDGNKASELWDYAERVTCLNFP